jgi:hypothetical protein
MSEFSFNTEAFMAWEWKRWRQMNSCELLRWNVRYRLMRLRNWSRTLDTYGMVFRQIRYDCRTPIGFLFSDDLISQQFTYRVLVAGRAHILRMVLRCGAGDSLLWNAVSGVWNAIGWLWTSVSYLRWTCIASLRWTVDFLRSLLLIRSEISTP